MRMNSCRDDGEQQIIIVPLKDWLGPVASMQISRRKTSEIYIIKSDGLYKRSLKKGKWSPEVKMTYEEVTRPGPAFF